MSGQKKIPLISLSNMSLTPPTGGVGFHNLPNRNLAFGGKLVWKMYSHPSLKWCQLMQQKYLDNLDPSRVISTLDPPKGSMI